jgi:hypothetical protein
MYGSLQIPETWDWPRDVGLHVGACITGRRPVRTAHAHNYTTDPHFGWICVRNPDRVLDRAGGPSYTLLHELAHLLVPNQHHTRAWQRQAVKLGVPPAFVLREAAALRYTQTPREAQGQTAGARQPRRAVPARQTNYTRKVVR